LINVTVNIKKFCSGLRIETHKI